MSVERRPWAAAPRFMPLLGVAAGAVGAGVYWIGTLIWPSSVAVLLAMIAIETVSRRSSAAAEAGGRPDAAMLRIVLTVLVKYSALMALSAANLPFALPANLALGVIMIAGNAASWALLVSAPSQPPASHADLAIALAIGFAPAVLMGLPGLIGLVAAIAARFAFVMYLRTGGPGIAPAELAAIRQVTEVCFYLGALGSWAYI
jgi:cobalamin synthase